MLCTNLGKACVHILEGFHSVKKKKNFLSLKMCQNVFNLLLHFMIFSMQNVFLIKVNLDLH